MHNNININVSGPIQPTSIYKTKVLKGNHSFDSQITEPNMKYVIKHDFDLGGESVTIPEGCLLEFDGGSLKNGKLIGDTTTIKATDSVIFDNIDLTDFGSRRYNVKWFAENQIFSELYVRIEELLAPYSTLFSDKDDIIVNDNIPVTKNINFDFKDIVVTNKINSAFLFGDKNNQITRILFKANNIRGDYQDFDVSNKNYINLENFFIRIQNCTYSNFTLQSLEHIGYPIYFYPLGPCGQNIFMFNEIREGNRGVVFSNGEATNWSESKWCEGTQIKFGFIVRFNVGIEFQEYCKCKANLYVGAIDNMEIDGSYDILDNSNKTIYQTKSLWLLNFYRKPASIIDEGDTILDPAYGLYMAGSFVTKGFVNATNAITTNNHIKIKAASNARLDINDDSGDFEDYKGRIILEGDGKLAILRHDGAQIKFGEDYADVYKGFRFPQSGNNGPYVIQLGTNDNLNILKPGNYAFTFKRDVLIHPFCGTKTLTAGNTEITINRGGSGFENTNYSVCVTPRWSTGWYLKEKNTVGFKVVFDTPPSEDSEFDYFVYGLK